MDVILPVIADYGVERLIGERRDQGRISSSRRDAYASALDPRSDLKRLFSFLERLDEQIVRAQAFEDDVPRLAKLQFSAVEQACDSVLAPVGWGRPRWDSTIEGVTLTHPDHGTLPLTSMATGTKIAAGLAIDLASRMARANPGLGAEELLTRTPGIVLIDEVDLHLHPSWQQRIVPSLRRTFPNVQFILTTHSPQVLSTVPAKSVRILDESGVSTPKFSEGLRPNVILEKLQGTDPVPQVPVRQELQKYVEMVSQGQGSSPEAVALRADLDQRLGGASLNPELLQADIALDIADWDY